MTVRPAVEEDVSVICDFVHRLADYEKLAHEVSFTELHYKNYLFLSKHEPAPEVILACDDEHPIGMALFIPLMTSTIHLEDLFVLPEARGKGAGIALLSALAKMAVQRGALALEWSCLDWNKSSLDFYASLGARPIPARTLFRITGSALRDRVPHKHRVNDIQEKSHELDPRLRGLELLDASGDVIGSLFYTLSFTTFLATPVILVTSIVSEAPFDSTVELIDHLISIANANHYSRIDLRVNPTIESDLAQRIVNEFGAFEMTGWIPHEISGEALLQLASRS